MAGSSWKQSPPELVALFEALAGRLPESAAVTVAGWFDRAIAHVWTPPPNG
ncbi:MAG TPA: hypothetical protein VER83_06100 [Candidatus Nanopelagicales bacterium]|nr:hypothetical protein [Candidatus Nanopelagicales bacterium]